MTRKLFYFVRHGESLLNAAGIRQGSEGSLSPSGKEQAKVTGERLSQHPIQVILASPYIRTRETADIINGCFKKPRVIEYNDLLKERRNPSEIVGQSVEDVNVKRIVDTIDKTFHTDEYRYSDEENFQDLKGRARDLLDYLSTRPEKFILVVTHGIFLRMVIAYIIYGDQLNSATYNTLGFLNTSNNTAVTVCEYKRGWFGPPAHERWKLIAWDDYSKKAGPQSKGI